MMETNMARNGFEPAPVEIRFSDAVFAGPQASVEGFDVLDLLPSAAADKLRALRQRAEDLHKVVPEFERLQDASLERIKVERELKRLTDAASDGGFNLPATDHRVIVAQRRLDKLTAETQRLRELREARSAAWQTVSRVQRDVEDWLRSDRPSGTTFADHDGEAPTLNKGETILDAVERLRRRGRELRADLHRVQSAPYPASFAKQRMREQVEILAQRGAPSVSQLVEHSDGKFEFPLEMLRSQIHNVPNAPGAVAYGEIVNPVAVVAWLFKDQMIAALDREIASEADDKTAISPDDRQRKEAVLLGDLLAVERDESFFVWMAMSQNMPVEFRADADPRAILQCRLVTPPTKSVVPGSSPQHVREFRG
jgi:hypothetical protein